MVRASSASALAFLPAALATQSPCHGQQKSMAGCRAANAGRRGGGGRGEEGCAQLPRTPPKASSSQAGCWAGPVSSRSSCQGEGNRGWGGAPSHVPGHAERKGHSSCR